MKRERIDFHRWSATLRDFYFDALIYGGKRTLLPAMEHALEIAYMTGALDSLGLAMGHPGDDIRTRALALQRQAAERLGELRDKRHGNDNRTPFNLANRTTRRRARQHDKRVW
jgi:hypothetical protein